VQAGVCETERPFWDSAAGPATALDEALHLAASPLALALLVATALAVRFRNSWAGLAVVCGWSGLVALVTFAPAAGPATGSRQQAIQEGCIGSPALFIAVVAAISVATVIYTSPRQQRKD
jgi:cellobiose-specific phosphotransferase system component IIC